MQQPLQPLTQQPLQPLTQHPHPDSHSQPLQQPLQQPLTQQPLQADAPSFPASLGSFFWQILGYSPSSPHSPPSTSTTTTHQTTTTTATTTTPQMSAQNPPSPSHHTPNSPYTHTEVSVDLDGPPVTRNRAQSLPPKDSESSPLDIAPPPVSASALDENAFSASLRQSISSAMEREVALTLLERKDTTEKLLDTPLAKKLRRHFPRSLRLSTQLKLIYSMDQHGISLHTVYNNMQDAVNGGKVSPKGFLIIVQSTEGDLFGAFISDILHPHAGYYGTGECFLWKLEPTSSPITPSTLTSDPESITPSSVSKPSASPQAQQPAHQTSTSSNTSSSDFFTPSQTMSEKEGNLENKRPKVFSWTGKNDYFILSEVGFFAVGGGDGDFGLYLDSNLEHGHSASVPTFGNEVLTCTGGKEFMCCGFEVWGIGD